MYDKSGVRSHASESMECMQQVAPAALPGLTCMHISRQASPIGMLCLVVAGLQLYLQVQGSFRI